MSHEPCTLFWPRSGFTPTPGPPDISGRHREVRDPEHHRAALAMLRNAEAVVNRGVGRAGIQTRGGANLIGGHAGDFLDASGELRARRRTFSTPRTRAGRIAAATNASSVRCSVTTTCASALISATLVPGRSCRWYDAATCGMPHNFGDARIRDDQLRALAEPALHLRGEHRMPFGDVRADHHDHVGMHHRFEILGCRRRAERRLEAVAGRRMTNARAGVDVVVAEPGAHQLLDQKSFLVGASRGRNCADRAASVLFLDAPQLRRRVVDRLAPRHLTPWLID